MTSRCFGWAGFFGAMRRGGRCTARGDAPRRPYGMVGQDFWGVAPLRWGVAPLRPYPADMTESLRSLQEVLQRKSRRG